MEVVGVKEEPRDDLLHDVERDQSKAMWGVYSPWVNVHPSDVAEKPCELKVPNRQMKPNVDMFVYDDDGSRTRRESIPEEKKDTSYWIKRHKNNESARRSRLKRRMIEQTMESQLKELQKENIELKYELAALRRYFGVDMAHEDLHTELSMRNGSASDSSDASSVVSENENYTSQTELDLSVSQARVVDPVSHPSPNLPKQFYPSLRTPIPFKYSFLNATSQSECSPADSEVETLTKVPHKFRLKRDYHSAFYVQPESIA